MKLVRVQISSFGTLNDFEYDFNKDLNCILRDNGTGKTTLSAFICAMLYGMESSRSNEKGLKERSHYAPWSGGKFGGILTLEAGGRIYRIERTFDRLSASKDTVKIYDVTYGVLETELEPSPGEALLGISRDAFLRTAYIGASEKGNVEGILPKINMYVGGALDKDLYSIAEAILLKEKKKYKPEKGRGGSIEGLIEEKKRVEKELDRCLASADAEEEHERLLDAAEKRKKECADRLALADAYAEALLLRRTHEEFKAKEAFARQTLEDFYDQNGRACPTDGEFEEGKELLFKIAHYRQKLTDEPLEEGEKAELLRLKGVFSASHTDSDEIDDIYARRAQLLSDRERKKEAEALVGQEEFKTLIARFDKNCPDNNKICELEELNRAYSAAKKEYDERRARLLDAAKRRAEEKRAIPKQTLFFVGGGLLSLVVSVIFFASSLPVPWLFIVVSLLCFVAAYIFAISGKKSTSESENDDEKVEERYNDLQRRYADMLNYYGYFGEDLPLLFENLKEDLALYLQRGEQYARARSVVGTLEKRIAENEEVLRSFFARYRAYVRADGQFALNYLREDCCKYNALEEKLRDSAQTAEKDRALLAQLCARFAAIFQKYTVDISEREEQGVYDRLYARAEKQRALEKEYAARKKDAEEYVEQHPYSRELPGNIPTKEEKEELERERMTLQAATSQLEKKIEEERRYAERADEYKARTEELERLIDKQSREYRILTVTRDYLDFAQKRLMGKYTEPLIKAYQKYASAIAPQLCENAYLTPGDLALCFERAGELRKVECFSSGFTALADLCLRLAMIDVAYSGERPFIILDDPFVYLDDEKLNKTLGVLRELSQNTQLLYLTCHSDRSI